MSIQRYSLSSAVSSVRFHTATSAALGQPGPGLAAAADTALQEAQAWQQLCQIVPPDLSLSILPCHPTGSSLCLLLEVSKYLIFPHQTSTINEQGKRSVVRQAMLALGISCRTATKQELSELRSLGSLSVNAPTATWITVQDSCRLLLRYDQHQWAAILAKLFDIDLSALASMGYARHTIVPHQTEYRRAPTSRTRKAARGRRARQTNATGKGKHSSKKGRRRGHQFDAGESESGSSDSSDMRSSDSDSSDSSDSDQEYAPRSYTARRGALLHIRNAAEEERLRPHGSLGITSATNVSSHALQLHGQQREARARSDSAAMPYTFYHGQHPAHYHQGSQIRTGCPQSASVPSPSVKLEMPDSTASLHTDAEDHSAHWGCHQNVYHHKGASSDNDRQGASTTTDTGVSSRLLHSGSDSGDEPHGNNTPALYRQRSYHAPSPPMVATYARAPQQLPANPLTPPGTLRGLVRVPSSSSAYMRPDLLDMSAGIAHSPRNNDVRGLQVDVSGSPHSGTYGRASYLSPSMVYTGIPPAQDLAACSHMPTDAFPVQMPEMRFPALPTVPSTPAAVQPNAVPPFPSPLPQSSSLATSTATPLHHYMMTPPTTPRLHTPASFLSSITASNRLAGGESYCYPLQHRGTTNSTPTVMHTLLDSPRSSHFFSGQH